MVDIGDPTGIIITIILGIGVPLLLFSMKSFGKTQEGTLTGTIELKGVKSNLDEVKETMDKGFEKMEGLLNKRDEQMRIEFSKTNEKIEQLSTKVSLQEYRLTSLERTRIGNVTRDRDRDRYADDGGQGGG